MSVARMPRLLPAPDPNPPYDAIDAPWPPPLREAVGQGVLPLRFPTAFAPVPPHRPSAEDTSVEERCRAFARAVAEALCGARSPAQLRYGLTGNAHRRLLYAVRVSPGSLTVTTTHVQRVAPGAVEVAATLHGRERSHLMALRLELRHERWVCTTLDTGFLPRRR